MDKTKLLLPISKSEDPKLVNQMKKDLKHIRAYLLRRIHFLETGENEYLWTKFKSMTFYEFLKDLGMFEGISPDVSEEEAKQQAKKCINIF